MNLDHILVDGCPLCDIFKDPLKHIKTKLYYPDINSINSTDFIILDSKDTGVPLIIVRDHVSDLNKTIWGRILFQSRRLFGPNIRLVYKPRKIKDHYHCYVYTIKN